MVLFMIRDKSCIQMLENQKYSPKKKRGEGDLNPRILTNMGLAIPRPTRLGDPRSSFAKLYL